jgi:acetolactate synthase regulatory subunit
MMRVIPSLAALVLTFAVMAAAPAAASDKQRTDINMVVAFDRS